MTVNKLFSFPEMLNPLRDGHRIRREAWEKGAWLWVHDDNRMEPHRLFDMFFYDPVRDCLPPRDVSEEGTHPTQPVQQYLIFHTADKSFQPWTPTTQDLFADDWTVTQ